MATLTIAEAKRMLHRAGLPTPDWLNGPVKDRSGIETLEKEHAEKIAKMRKDADERIEKSRQHQRDLIAKSKRHKELLREERIEEQLQKDRVELTWRRDHREFIHAIGGPLSEPSAVTWSWWRAAALMSATSTNAPEPCALRQGR